MLTREQVTYILQNLILREALLSQLQDMGPVGGFGAGNWPDGGHITGDQIREALDQAITAVEAATPRRADVSLLGEPPGTRTIPIE